MKVILHVNPALGTAEEMERMRPIGRDAAAYQRALDGLVELARAADELGFWGIAHAEQHFHSEGLELSPSPLLLNVYLSRHTKRLRHGQLGLVLPSHDPLRLAAEVAVADHMLGGRLFVGLTRGYEARWQNVLSQKFGVEATRADEGEADQRSWVVFSENFKLMRAAWESDLLSYDGPTYKVPHPFEGIRDWPPGEAVTERYGAPGELGDDGALRGVSVVPKPLTEPHPELFHSFDASPRAMAWCGAEGVTPMLIVGSTERLAELTAVFAEAGGAGRGIGVCRAFHVVENGVGKEAARAAVLEHVERHEAIAWRDWYDALGVLGGTPLAFDGSSNGARAGESIGERLLRSGLLIGGTVDAVKRQIEDLLRRVPVEYLTWLLRWGLVPAAECLRSIELFASKVMPEFGMKEPAALADT